MAKNKNGRKKRGKKSSFIETGNVHSISSCQNITGQSIRAQRVWGFCDCVCSQDFLPYRDRRVFYAGGAFYKNKQSICEKAEAGAHLKGIKTVGADILTWISPNPSLRSRLQAEWESFWQLFSYERFYFLCLYFYVLWQKRVLCLNSEIRFIMFK